MSFALGTSRAARASPAAAAPGTAASGRQHPGRDPGPCHPGPVTLGRDPGQRGPPARRLDAPDPSPRRAAGARRRGRGHPGLQPGPARDRLPGPGGAAGATGSRASAASLAGAGPLEPGPRDPAWPAPARPRARTSGPTVAGACPAGARTSGPCVARACPAGACRAGAAGPWPAPLESEPRDPVRPATARAEPARAERVARGPAPTGPGPATAPAPEPPPPPAGLPAPEPLVHTGRLVADRRLIQAGGRQWSPSGDTRITGMGSVGILSGAPRARHHAGPGGPPPRPAAEARAGARHRGPATGPRHRGPAELGTPPVTRDDLPAGQFRRGTGLPLAPAARPPAPA